MENLWVKLGVELHNLLKPVGMNLNAFGIKGSKAQTCISSTLKSDKVCKVVLLRIVAGININHSKYYSHV